MLGPIGNSTQHAEGYPQAQKLAQLRCASPSAESDLALNDTDAESRSGIGMAHQCPQVACPWRGQPAEQRPRTIHTVFEKYDIASPFCPNNKSDRTECAVGVGHSRITSLMACHSVSITSGLRLRP